MVIYGACRQLVWERLLFVKKFSLLKLFGCIEFVRNCQARPNLYVILAQILGSSGSRQDMVTLGPPATPHP